MSDMASIHKQAEKYATARYTLETLVNELQKDIDELKKEKMPAIKRAVEKAAAQSDALKAMVEESPELFKKPKTVIVNGIKFGFKKNKGSITFDNEEKVIELIKKRLPEQSDLLIQTKLSVAKNGLANLSVDDLKKIGCTVVNTDDSVVIASIDSDLDKLVDALLKSASEVEA